MLVGVSFMRHLSARQSSRTKRARFSLTYPPQTALTCSPFLSSIANLSPGRISSRPFPLEMAFLSSTKEISLFLVVMSCIVFSSVQKILQK